MASVGHIAVGMAAARLYHSGRTATPPRTARAAGTPVPRWSSLASWSALSLLPDVDVIGFALGVDYADPWGHRGATHSLTSAIALGLAVGLGARRFKQPVRRTALFASVVLASHAVLDSMTDGGLGCALLWPFDLTRYFAPWRPIPVAPIGPDFLSPGGGLIALTELVLFGPLLVFALRFPRIARKPVAAGFLAVLWSVCAWLILSGDRVRDATVGLLLREDTAYASGFSEKAFRTITPGKSDEEVRHLLGAPLGEDWLYAPKNQPFESASNRSALALSHECLILRFEKGVVVSARDVEACGKLGIKAGMSLSDVDQRLGSPPERCWQYSRSPGGAHYRIRVVCFTNDRVTTVIRRWN